MGEQRQTVGEAGDDGSPSTNLCVAGSRAVIMRAGGGVDGEVGAKTWFPRIVDGVR